MAEMISNVPAWETSNSMMPTMTATCKKLLATETSPADIATVVRGHLGNELKAYFGLLTIDTLPDRLAALVSRFEMAVKSRGETSTGAFRDDLMAAMPTLRTFAFSLAGNMSFADDLVQETLMKAWSNQHRFEPGTNLSAWLFTIMRNQFYTEIRKRKREVEDADGAQAAKLTAVPEQEGVVALQRLYTVMGTLPIAQREALLLVGAEGLTYEEAAQRQGCQVGTVKSRVSRARSQLAGLFDFNVGGPVMATP